MFTFVSVHMYLLVLVGLDTIGFVQENRTPLHVAAHLGLTDTVKLLLSHEANFEAQDKYGNTALHLACDSGNVATVQALLGAGKKITLRTKNREGQTPLHNAVCLGEVEMVKALMAAGGRLDVKDKVSACIV